VSFCSFCSGLTLWVSVIAEPTKGKGPQAYPGVSRTFDELFDAGHGLGSTRLQGVREWADDFAFLLWQLGEKDFQVPAAPR
jgi:hypothetical protein